MQLWSLCIGRLPGRRRRSPCRTIWVSSLHVPALYNRYCAADSRRMPKTLAPGSFLPHSRLATRCDPRLGCRFLFRRSDKKYSFYHSSINLKMSTRPNTSKSCVTSPLEEKLQPGFLRFLRLNDQQQTSRSLRKNTSLEKLQNMFQAHILDR